MSLLERIKASQLDARKKRDHEAAALLTTLIGDASMVGKNNGNRESTDGEVIATIKKFIASAEENLQIITNNQLLNMDAQMERMRKAGAEIGILRGLLPTQMANEEVENEIGNIITETSATSIKDMGKVMKILKDRHDGKYDGTAASKMVKSLLGAA